MILSTAEMLQLVNQARRDVGHPLLVLDPYLMIYAQTVADMAANSLPPSAKGAVQSVIEMGYGYPETIDTIFCTSSFVILYLSDQNPADSLPFASPSERAIENIYYRHVGFGVAKGVGDWDGYIFYQMLACYTADNKYNPDRVLTPGAPTPQTVSQIIYPVYTAQVQANGQLVHEVRAGQSLWAIAVAYQTHIKDILQLNNLPPDWNTVYEGQKLLIPTLQGGRMPVQNTAVALTVKPVATLDVKNEPLKPGPILATASFKSGQNTPPNLAPTPTPEAQPMDEQSALGIITVTVIAGVLIFVAIALLLRR
ncbi:MAG: LysM peptidoglycan-binding domain-containing protein [Anaerolineae bacterium]|nr:LysM peptidoglycan-binding domain-containing protein [Anaerolineae bacterium]